MHAQAGSFGGGMTKAVIAHGAQSPGQDVSEIAAHKLYARQGEQLAAVLMGAIFPAERDGLAGEREQACVVDGGAGNVSAQVLNGGSSGARRLDVHPPLLGPDLWVHLPIVLLKQLVEVLSKGALQMRQIDQELVAADPDIVAGVIEPGAWNQAVNMGMELQALVPGMEHGGKAAGGRAQAFVLGEFFTEGGLHGAEEQIVGLLGERTKEATAQLGGKREGDQEVGRVDEFMNFACHPAARGQGAALRAGFVVAGVIGEVNLMAGVADKGAPAQSRRAAMSDGPDGAALLCTKRRLGVLELRQKSAQRPHDSGALGHRGGEKLWLGGQSLAKLIDQSQSVLTGLVSEMQVNHGAVDLGVAEQLLDRMQMRPGLQQVRGETVPLMPSSA